MIPLESLPALNAWLNAGAAVSLVAGYLTITNRPPGFRPTRLARRAHAGWMLTALGLSAAFLASYLWYHFHHGATPYPRRDWTRPVYFTVLVTHTVFAVLNVPAIAAVVWFAARGTFDRHKRLARWVLPSWLYVSVTGVVVYWMLYRW